MSSDATDEESASIKETLDKKKATLPWEKIFLAFRVAVIAACAGVVMWQMTVGMAKYLSRLTRTVLAVKPTAEATFVSFSVCPHFSRAYKDDLLRKYGSSRHLYNRGDYTTSPGAPADRDLFDMVTYKVDEILESVVVTTSADRFIQHSIPLGGNSTWQSSEWKTKSNSLLGKCFSMEIKKTLASLKIASLEFKSRMNAYVFLHHPGQFYDFSSNTKVPLQLGRSLEIHVSYNIDTNTIEDDAELPCRASMDFDFDHCLTGRVNQGLLAKFGCTIPYLPSVPESPICGQDKRKEAITLSNSLLNTEQKSLCARPCSAIEVFTGLPFNKSLQEETDNTGVLNLRLKSTTRVKKRVLDYTLLHMVADVGGYTGLLLGVSLVDLITLMSRITLVAMNHHQVQQEGLRCTGK